MKRAFLFTAIMIGLLPLACIKPCPEEPASQTIPENLDFQYGGTESSVAPTRKDTFAFVMDTNFYIVASIKGTTKYLGQLEQPWLDPGFAYARAECPPGPWYGFNPGIDSISIKADRNIGIIPAGESLNSVFLARYSNTDWTKDNFIPFQAYNDSLQTSSFKPRTSITLKPNNIYFFGKHVFTVTVYLKDGTQVNADTDILIFE